MVNRVRMYDEVFPQLDGLVSTLYRLLSVHSLDAIAPRVQALVASGAASGSRITPQSPTRPRSTERRARTKVDALPH